MSNRTLKILKVLAHLACAGPIAWLLLHALQNNLGPDPTHTVTFFTGKGTLRLLVLSLAITPIRRLIAHLAWIIRFRRMLGLWAFFYGCLHLLSYLWLDQSFDWAGIWKDIYKRPFITVGFAAWLLMLASQASRMAGQIS